MPLAIGCGTGRIMRSAMISRHAFHALQVVRHCISVNGWNWRRTSCGFRVRLANRAVSRETRLLFRRRDLIFGRGRHAWLGMEGECNIKMDDRRESGLS